MKNQQQAPTDLISILYPERNEVLFAERNHDGARRDPGQSLWKGNREGERKNSALPAGQWINRAENDGLDFFL